MAIGGGQILVSLDNLTRDFEKDGDAGRISRFVDAIVASAIGTSEKISRDQLYWNLEQNDLKDRADFHIAVSDKLDRVLVHVSADGRLITWVTPEMLASMGISQDDAFNAAFANLAKALSGATLSHEEIHGVPLGMIATKLPSKASLILAPNLNEVVGTKLGWPLVAVVPDRDFLYLWPAKHTDFAGRVGPVVVREFSKASYPLSTEVFEISDGGIRALGAFATEAPAAHDVKDTKEMKTVNYRGGLVRFRIPKEWKEEYEEAGGGTFYQPGDDTGTLRLNVLSFQGPAGKSLSAASALATQAEKNGSEVVELRDGVAMTQYDLEAEETGHRLRMRRWEIAQLLPPNHLRMVVFTYTLLAEQFDKPEFSAELTVLDHEVAACELAQVQGVLPPSQKKPWWRPW